jgi:hypothetical protein
MESSGEIRDGGVGAFFLPIISQYPPRVEIILKLLKAKIKNIGKIENEKKIAPFDLDHFKKN